MNYADAVKLVVDELDAIPQAQRRGGEGTRDACKTRGHHPDLDVALDAVGLRADGVRRSPPDVVVQRREVELEVDNRRRSVADRGGSTVRADVKRPIQDHLDGVDRIVREGGVDVGRILEDVRRRHCEGRDLAAIDDEDAHGNDLRRRRGGDDLAVQQIPRHAARVATALLRSQALSDRSLAVVELRQLQGVEPSPETP